MVTAAQQQPHERIFNILFQEDELTWQNIIYDLVRSEQMDAWDINITLIAQKFIERLKELKEMDFRISGKVVLASAMLLKMKTNRLLEEDMTAFDNLMQGVDEEPMDILEELSEEVLGEREPLPKIVPRTPQPRKRKVSVFDLVEALEKALKVQNKRKKYVVPDVDITPPKKTKELTLIMKDVYDRVSAYFSTSKEKLSFQQLVPSDTKEDKVLTFVPLLHLENQTKINMAQEEHFGDIFISLVNKKSKIKSNKDLELE